MGTSTADFDKWCLDCFFCKKERSIKNLEGIAVHGGKIYNYCKDNKKCCREADAMFIASKLKK